MGQEWWEDVLYFTTNKKMKEKNIHKTQLYKKMSDLLNSKILSLRNIKKKIP